MVLNSVLGQVMNWYLLIFPIGNACWHLCFGTEEKRDLNSRQFRTQIFCFRHWSKGAFAAENGCLEQRLKHPPNMNYIILHVDLTCVNLNQVNSPRQRIKSHTISPPEWWVTVLGVDKSIKMRRTRWFRYISSLFLFSSKVTAQFEGLSITGSVATVFW